MIVTVRLGGERREVVAEPGETLDRIAARADWPLNTVCGGLGRCGRCAVVLQSGHFRGRNAELYAEPSHPRRALACQMTPLEGAPCEFEIPDSSRRIESGRMVADCAISLRVWKSRLQGAPLRRPADQLGPPTSDVELARDAILQNADDVEFGIEAVSEIAMGLGRPDAGDVWWIERDGRAFAGGARATMAGQPLGLAVDIGTTTVVTALVELASGRQLANASDYNAQLSRGADVASRITAAETPGGVAELQRLVRGTINELIQRLCSSAGRSPDDILHVVITGNTVMQHLALGLPPHGIGRIPFRPVVRRYPLLRAERLGLAVCPLAWVEAVPSLSGYIGGDLTADATVAGLLQRRGRWLLVDIGTNGEILFWDGHHLRCTATAAGPAFEGAGLSCGMCADAGAVERLRWRGDHFEYETIGGARPAGLCGSAVVDALAELAQAGLMDTTGRLDTAALDRRGAAAVIRQAGHPVHAVVIAPSEASAHGVPVVLSEADIAEALKAKAAIHAGIMTLLHLAGCGPADLDGLVLAGGFGRHLHLRNAMRIGLLPELPPECIEVIGNGALGGALQGLGDPAAPAEWDRLLRVAEPIELNLCDKFETEFVDSLLVPHADPTRFARLLAADSGPPIQRSPSTSRQIV